MDARFYLYINNVEHIITEPVGYDAFTIKLKRDPNSHGLAFEFSETTLSFDGIAYSLIKAQYDLLGTSAIVFFKSETKCSDTDDWQQEYYGQLEMTTYNDVIEQYNHIDVNVSQQSDEISIANRKDQEVALTTRVGFDGAALSEYPALDKEVTLQPMDVILSSKAYKESDQYSVNTLAGLEVISSGGSICDVDCLYWASGNLYYFFDRVKTQEMGPIQASGPVIDIFANRYNYPFFKLIRNTNMPSVSMRLKIAVTIDMSGKFIDRYVGLNILRMSLFKVVGNVEIDRIYLEADQAYLRRCGTQIYTFSYDGVIDISADADGTQYILTNGLNSYFEYNGGAGDTDFPIEINPIISIDSFFEVKALSSFNATTAKAAMIHETASRIIEAITDGNLAVKSDFFSRPDSNVKHQKTNVSLANTSANLGYGSMLCLLNGYQIRKSLKSDGSSPFIAIKWKEFIENLQAIYNVGYGIEYDEAVGANVLRIEPWYYFYNSEIVFTINLPTKKERKTETSELYSKLEIGYSAWETESFNGQDAFLTGRTYRTKTNVIDNTLSKICKWIADGFAFEATRRKILDLDTKDYKYDEKIFCLTLQDDGLNVIYSSRNGVENGENLISPTTVYNAMISPARMAMRWTNRFIQLLTINVTRGVYFLSGTGNYLAKGRVINDGIVKDNIVLDENQDYNNAVFKTDGQFIPKLKPETIPVEYPVSKQDFEIIKQNPRGRVILDGEITYIKELVYNPRGGIGKFILLPSYETE